MQQSDVPLRFPIPFGASAGSSYIRTIPRDPVAPTGIDAPASLTEGFPPECFLPESSGGIPPNGKDFNGILNQITAMCRWLAAGGPAIFNSEFAAAIGGYPKGARLTSTVTAGLEWISTVENNLTNPDSGSAANWAPIVLQSAFTGGNQSLSPTGFQKLPGGLIVQWGAGTAPNNGTASVNFPITFPTYCIGAWVNAGKADNGAQDNYPTAMSWSNSSFVVTNAVESLQMRWFALGY